MADTANRPAGFAYVHVRRDERARPVISWREPGAQAVERRHVLDRNASEWTDDQLRLAGVKYLGLDEGDVGFVELGQR